MKKIIIAFILATLLCTTVSCKDDAPTDSNEISETVSDTKPQDSTAPEETQTKRVYSYDEKNNVTLYEYNSDGKVSSVKKYDFTGTLSSWKTYDYINGFSVSEKTADGKAICVRYYNEDASLKYIDVYTDTGISRWTDASDGVAERTKYNRDGKATEIHGFVGRASLYKQLDKENHIYNIVCRADGSHLLRNEFKDGVQQKSISYNIDGSIQSTKEFFYNESGKNIRVDQYNAAGEMTQQVLYGYNENGSYSYTETKQNGITVAKTEYVYDETGKQTAELVYKFDENGKPTEYEKWTVTDGNKESQGVFPATDGEV